LIATPLNGSNLTIPEQVYQKLHSSKFRSLAGGLSSPGTVTLLTNVLNAIGSPSWTHQN
jgi:hypothetical protein